MTISPEIKDRLFKVVSVIFLFLIFLTAVDYIAEKIIAKAVVSVSKKISEKTKTEVFITGPGYSIIPLKFTVESVVVKKNGNGLILLDNCSINNPVSIFIGKNRNIESRCKNLSVNQSEILPFVKDKIGGGDTPKNLKSLPKKAAEDYSIDMTIEKTSIKFAGSQETFWTNIKMKNKEGVLRIKGLEGKNSEGFLEILFSIDEKKADLRFDNVSLKMFDKLIIDKFRPKDFSGIVDGNVNIKKTGDIIRISTDLTVLDIAFEHPLIDSFPYKLPFLRIESNSEVNYLTKDLHTDESKFSIGGIEGIFEGNWGSEKKSFKLYVKKATLNKLETLVRGEPFKGFNLAGYLDLDVNYSEIKGKEPVFEVKGEIVDVKQLSDRLDYLVSSFPYSFKNRSGNVSIFTVGPANDDFTPIEYIPEHVYWAVVISEDAGFFMHPGVDFAELGAAVLDNIKNKKLRGGSTITQQLAKNLFLNRKKTLIRKFQEVLLAVELDATFSKNRLLEMYLNIIEWAPGIFGISQAAYYYFGKTVYDLTPLESAYLASVIPGPYIYHYQFLTDNVSEQWLGNLHRILNVMQETGHITFEQYIDALGKTLTFREKQ